MMVYGDSIKDVTDKTNEIIAVLSSLGLIITLANTGVKRVLFRSIPGKFCLPSTPGNVKFKKLCVANFFT